MAGSMARPAPPTTPADPAAFRRNLVQTDGERQPWRDRGSGDDEDQPAGESSTHAFLVEEQTHQGAQLAVAFQSTTGQASLGTSVLALRMKQKLTSSWKATISVDMWRDLKQALDISPEHRTLTHCMVIDSWISKVFVLRSLRKRQRQEICKWIHYRAYETKQTVFERGDSADDGHFYMIFSGTVAVLAPKREEQLSPPAISSAQMSPGTCTNTYPLDTATSDVVQARSRRRAFHPRAAYLKLLSSGDSFGELAMLENPNGSGSLQRTATVEAQSPCMLLTLPRQHFLNSVLSFAGDERMAKVRKLSANQLFESWPLDALLLISYHCIKREFKAQDVIIDGDKENDHAYAILEGSCVLTVDDATQTVTRGFAVGADLIFESYARSNIARLSESKRRDLQERTGEEEKADEHPRRYHVVADGTCVAYAVPHELLQTLVPSAARLVLAELGQFRLATLKKRAERRRIRVASAAAEVAEAAQKQATVEAEDTRAREAWLSAQKRAVALRPPPASMGASPHLLLNTDAALRDLQRAQRRAHHTLLTEAVIAANNTSDCGVVAAPCVVGERHMSLEEAVRVVEIAESTVQKMQSSVGSLKAEVVQYGLLLRNAGRHEVHRLSSAVERLIELTVEAMRPDALVNALVKQRGLSWRKRPKVGSNGSDDRRTRKEPRKPPQSSQDVARRRRAWLREVPIFQAVPRDSPFFQVLATKLTERRVRRQTMVIEKSSVGTEMYFIVEGVVDVLASLDEPPFITLQAGAHFGDNALLTEERRNAYVRASKTVELYVLSKADLHKVFLEFPDVEAILQKHAEDRRLRDKVEREAAANALETNTGESSKRWVAPAPARSVEEIIRQLNLCSRLCSRTAVLLAMAVSWLRDGNPRNKDAEVAQEIAQRFAEQSADLKAALLLPVEMLHHTLRRSDPRVVTLGAPGRDMYE